MLTDILALLAAAVIAVPLFHRLGLGSVLGYLAAGAALGSWGLELIDNNREIREIAELGVIFLLFLIGIEIKPSRLWVMRRWIFGLGLGQMLITGGLLMGIALTIGIPVFPAFIVGFGLAMSSTAFALQLLGEKHQLPTITGRIALSVLLLQDLAVVPMMALVSLPGQDITLGISMARAILEAIIVVSCFILTGRYLLNPLLDLVAASRNSEVFIAAALLLVLGSAKIMAMFGLSTAMGAFLAGLMLAESHYRHQLVADIQPFRGILLGLFFMSVGFSLNFGLLLQQYWLVLALVCLLVMVKIPVLWGICRLSQLNNDTSLRIALLLFQGGEFGFVLFALAMVKEILSVSQFQILTLSITISMVLTPLVVKLGDWLLHRQAGSKETLPMLLEFDSKRPHVIIAGFGRVGKRIATLAHMAKIPYLALDFNQERVAWGKEQGFSVYYGNASRLEVLRSAGIENASMLVAALDNDQHTEQLVCLVHHSFPKLIIHARARDSKHCEQLLRLGASNVVSENLEASLGLGELVLSENGISRKKLQRLLQEYREQYYQNMANTAKSDIHQ